MARGINKVILVGNVGGEPDVRYMPNGNAVTTLSIATSETWKDKQTGEKQERTEWHRVVFYNRLGEIAGEYLKKGAKVYVEGSLRTRKWQDPQGQDRYSTEIIAAEMQMLDSKSSMPSAHDQSYSAPPSDQNNVQGSRHQNHAQNHGTPASSSPMPAFEGLDDDVPF